MSNSPLRVAGANFSFEKEQPKCHTWHLPAQAPRSVTHAQAGNIQHVQYTQSPSKSPSAMHTSSSNGRSSAIINSAYTSSFLSTWHSSINVRRSLPTNKSGTGICTTRRSGGGIAKSSRFWSQANLLVTRRLVRIRLSKSQSHVHTPEGQQRTARQTAETPRRIQSFLYRRYCPLITHPRHHCGRSAL